MSRLLMALLALGLGLSVAGCSGPGFAQPVPAGSYYGYSGGMMGGGG